MKRVILCILIVLFAATCFAWPNRPLRSSSGTGGGGPGPTCVTGNDANTKLLLHMEGTEGAVTFVDNSAGGGHTADITVVNDAHITTADKKFGASSMICDGTGDKIQVDTSADWNWGTDPFTVDFWVKFNNVKATYLFNSSNSKTLEMTPTNIALYDNAKEYFNVAHGFSSGNWYHLTLVRNVNDINFYKSGVSIAAGNCTGDSFDWSPKLNIGDYTTPGAGSLDGYIDEFRLSKGVARWTANFSPPGLPYCN